MAQKNKNTTTLKLSFMDRMHLASILPQEGNMTNMILGRTLADKVKPTPKEATESGMKADAEGGMTFTKIDLKEKSYTFEPVEIDFLKTQVDKLDRENKISFQSLALCEQIKELKKGL